MLLTFGARAQTSIIKKADSLYAMGNYSEAIASYEKQVPKNQYIQLQLAKAHKSKGTYKDALAYYTLALSDNKEPTPDKLAYAKLLLTSRKLKEADSVYSQLIRKSPDNPDFQYRTGLVKKELKDSTAIQFFTKAFELDSTHQKSCFEISKYYLKKRDYPKVQEIAKKGLLSYPENPELLNVLGQNYILKESLWEALPYFEKLIELGHENEYIHVSIALCYKAEGIYLKAKKHFLESLRYNAQIPIRHTRLGDVYTKLEEHESALASYQMALQLKTAPIAVDLYKIAMSYRRQEKWDEAINYIRKSIKEDPSFKRAHYELALFMDATEKDPEKKLKYYKAFEEKFGKKQSYFNKMVEKRVLQLEAEVAAIKKNTE